MMKENLFQSKGNNLRLFGQDASLITAEIILKLSREY